MRELALHLLDIVENSVSAGAHNIRVEVEEDEPTDRLSMAVIDDGKGMDAETVARVIDPFYTSRTTRKVGLGIPLLKAAAEACSGGLTIQSEIGKGTCIKVDFQRSHFDRMPLGDLVGTFMTVLIGSPEVHWTFIYRMDSREFQFDDTAVKQELGDVPLSEPSVLVFLREYLQEGIQGVQKTPVEESN